MKLSMEIISDKLSLYAPETNISIGDMKIAGTRLLATAEKIRSDILYIASMRDYFYDDSLNDCVLCINGPDWLKLSGIDENEALALILDIFEDFDTWELLLRNAVESGREIQHFIDISKHALPFPVLITDTFGNAVGYSKEYTVGEVDIFWDSIVLHEKMHDNLFSGSLMDYQSQDVHDLETTAKIFQTAKRRIIGVRLEQDGAPIGTITVVEYGQSLSKGLCQLVDIFSKEVSSGICMRGKDAELRTAAIIVQDYLDGKSVDEDLLWNHIYSYVGQSNEDLELILFRNIRRADLMYKSYMSLRLSNAGIPCFCAPYHDYIMAVIAYVNEAEFLYKARELLSSEEYFCGVSLMFSSAETMRNALSQALFAIETGGKTAYSINKCVDYAYAHMIRQLAEDKNVSTRLLHPALKMLMKYDENHKTELYKTLYEYLCLERNVVATAKRLFIHRNTMLYRLQRLEALLNLDLNDINVRMYLMLSYHIDIMKGSVMTNHTFLEAIHGDS